MTKEIVLKKMLPGGSVRWTEETLVENYAGNVRGNAPGCMYLKGSLFRGKAESVWVRGKLPGVGLRLEPVKVS